MYSNGLLKRSNSNIYASSLPIKRGFKAEGNNNRFRGSKTVVTSRLNGWSWSYNHVYFSMSSFKYEIKYTNKSSSSRVLIP